ncbi:MAG: VWA domain-containing protein [Planctomycetota bacterium]
MTFRDPWFFLLLAVFIPALVWPFFRRRRGAVLPFSSARRLRGLPRSLRLRLRVLLPLLLACAAALLVTAVARPRTGRAEQRSRAEGVAMMMVLDRSGSMAQAMDDKGRTRMEVSKDVFRAFIMGDRERDLRGRPDDLAGLITFASFPTVSCPLTLSHAALVAATTDLQCVSEEQYGDNAKAFAQTAIGDALKLAAAKLVTAEEKLRADQGAGFKLKSKVIILLTDGENNLGGDPVEATTFAAGHGIRIYAVGIGSSGAQRRQDAFGGLFVTAFGSGGADMTTLNAVADATGGFAREATDAESLAAIYREIDKAEKTAFESDTYVAYDEHYRPFLIAGMALYLCFLLLDATLLGRVP